MDKIYNVQKNLKRCMKSNRKISFSMGLLISFLITGGIYTYANEYSHNEYSHQIFFNGDFNRNVNFDNTLKNFSYPDYPKTLDNKEKYEYFGSYGVKKINTKYMDFVSFSADLVPKKAPNISLIKPKNSTLEIKALDNINFDNPEIKDEKINKPQNKPETKDPINIQKIDRKPINTITLQNNVDIHIEKIEQITPKNPTYTNISPSKISNDILPQNIDIKFDKRIVAAPKLEDFTPPEPKTPVELGDTGFESMIYNEAYQLLDPDRNIGSERAEYNRGIVGQVSITNGTFKINNVYENGCYFAYKNYDSIPNYYANPDNYSYKNPIKLNDDNYLKEPKQFDLDSFDSADTDDIANVTYDDERFRTFYGLNSSAYGYFGKDVDISYISNAKNETTGNEFTNKNPNTVIYMETDSNSAQTLENLHNYKVVNDELYNEIKGYKDLSKLKDDDTFEFKKEIFPTGITLFNSEANVKLLGSYAKFVTVTTQYSDERANKRLSVFNNNGNISALNYTTNEDDDEDIKNQIIFYSTPDATPKYSDFQRYIYSNGQKGKINIYSNNAIGMYFTESGKNGFQNKLSTAFINNGEFNIYGANSTGVSLKRPAALGEKSGIYLLKPINIFGDEAVGVFLPGDVSKVPEENLQLRVNIGEKGNHTDKVTWTDPFPRNEEGDFEAEDAEPEVKEIPNVGNTEGNSEDKVDNSIGLFYANSNKAKIKIADIKLGEFAKNSTAIFASDGEVNISNGKIDIDGESNIGLLSQKNENKNINGGIITYNGNLTASGKKNKLAYTDNKDISIKGTVSSTSKDSVSIYADTGTIDLTNADLNINISGENVAAGYAINNGHINLKEGANIAINNDTPSNGTALVAKTGGVIEAKKAKIDIKNIVAGLSASDNNSKIDFTGGTLNYDGEGYSIYTDGKGKIDLSDANITLKGKAIGFDVDQDENSEQNVILNNKTRIKPESDDVILFNLKNSNGLDTKGGIRDHIISRIQNKLKKNNNAIDLTQLVIQPKAGEPGEFYKVSAMEGGNIKIGSLDKSAVSTDDINGEPDTDEKKAKKDGFQFYNRLHIQRLIATTHDNSTISAILNNSKASKFNNQVVALELSSSPSATSNAETQINIVKSNIIADRTEEGNGAIGLFINYGKINVDEGSTISVENENKVDNKQAVGIYAVNGSEVSNKGKVTVGSSNSVGILGENHRKATNNLEKDNFGDGKINISNAGTIEIKKEKSTGIYANNIDKEITDNTVVNSGTIKALGEHSNGIYSHKGTISNTGTIELGDKNVGIYSDSSKIKELGTIKFNSNNSTAIFVKGNSTIENGKTLTIESKDELSGNVGLYSENDLVTDLNINTNGKNITSYYTKSKALTVNADITTSEGENGVGIYGDNGSIIYGKDKTIKVSEKSFGILSHNSDVTLNGNIQLNSDLGKGIYFDSSEKHLNISGKITVNAKNVIGSYISNVTDSNKLTLTTPITFGENSDHSIAYLFNKSKFNNTSFTELKSKGTQHNTSIFALSENEINLGDKEVSIKSEDGQKGFTGIYLGENNKLTGEKIKVSDKATGIYSKNNNTVEIKNIGVDGQDTVGIYSEKNTTLNSINISSSNSAVGIYGKEGKITFSGDNTLNLSSKGTGIYLEYASLNGGNIKLVNTDTNNLVGVYFKDSKSSENTSNISIDNGTKLIGLYLDNAKVSNKGKIEATSGSSNTLAFVANESTFTNSGNLTLNSSDSHAIYVNNGSAENIGNITVDNEGTKPSVAMAGMKTDKDVNLTNDGNITVYNNSIGMYLDNGAIGNNTKEIVAQKKDSVGVYVNGNTTQFTNTSKISADNIGVYLNNTEKDKINLNSVTLTNDNAVAVYANNSKVDFEIKPTVKEGELPNNLISLYATGSTEISSKISTANGKNSIGIYLKDKDVSFKDGASVEITKGHKVGEVVSYNTGIYADSTYKGDLNVNIENTAENTIGIAVSEGSTVNYSGKITTGKDSIGILTKGTLVTKNSTFTINGGTGIFVDSTADAKIGTDENTIINLSNKATAIYQNGGKLKLGDKLIFGEDSIGTLLISRNAEVDSNISYSVKTDSLGVGLYYTDANNHNFTSNGRITLGSDNATGIYAQSTGTGTNTLKNNGEIITSDGMKNNIGIYADNVNVENNKVSVGENGVGIYLTKKVDLKNTEITLNGEHSVGIYSEEISNGSNYSVGKITSEKDNQTGLFIFNKDYDENKNITLSNLDINLANKSKGVGLQNATYTINEGSKITVGDNSTGLAFKNAKANVKADITVGKNSLALYAQGEKDVTFEGKITADNNSKWVYAKDKANITLNKFDNFTVNGGLGLGVDNATINTDKETKITVNGGTGAYINNGSISDKFKIDVQNGLGLYIQNGYNGTLPTVSLTGDNSKAYVLESLNKKFTVNDITLDKTNQIYIYSKGTGKGIDVKDIQIKGSDSYGIYNLANQDILAKDLNISGSNSFGIYSTVTDGTKKINVNKITVTGKNSAGVYSIKGDITQTGDIISQGLGIYSENGSVTLNGSKISLGDKDGIGVKVKNSNVTVSGDMTISKGIEGATGIYSEENGDITFNNNLVVDKNITGVYKNGTGTINLNGSSTTISENGIGVYSKGAEVKNIGSLNVTSKNAKGIYVENNKLTSTGTVTIDGENAIGLAGKGGEINSGDISVKGKNAVGIYSDEAKVVSNGKITSNSIGIYSKGSKDITQNGDITIGKDAVGIFKEGNGNVNITSENVTVGDKGYALYYLNDTNNKGTITANIDNMNLGSEAIGIYTKNGNLTYNGNINVGEKKNSAGIYADNSDVTFKGILNVSKPETIGIFAKGNSNVTIQNGSTINVSNGSYGIMTNDGSTGSITIEQGATFNISNLSYGISAYGNNKIINRGTFNIDANSTGIFHSFDSTISEPGNIPSDKIKTLNKKAKVAGIDIKFNGEVKFPKNIKVVNGGTIKVNGTVDINNMYLDFEHDNKPIIDAKSIAGTAIVTSNFSMGNSVNKLVYKDVFRPRDDNGFGKFAGDVTSQSASWIAKISKTEPDTKTYDIMMVRIPYTVMFKGEKNSQLGKSLEEIRSNIPKYTESKIFKDLDNVSTEKELTDTIANIRGDIYSNIQERMLDVDNTFDKSYKEVLDSHNVTDRVHKFSVIYSKNKHIDETFGVSSYDKDSYGILYLNDRENGANKYGFSVGLICSKFNFTGPTSLGSSEEMRSGKFGLHYQRTKDNLKYLTRLELGVNKHITNRVSNVNGMKYKYNANYWSYNIDWKNRLSYDIDVTKDFRITPYANLDVTYGKIFGINEDALTDPTLKLSVKPNSYFVITPRIGIDAKYDIELKNDMHISLKGNLEYHYDLNELYKRVNMAKFSSVKNYYELSIPGYRRSGLKVGGEVEIGKKDRYGVTFGATYDRAMKYSLRFNYKF